MTQPRWDGDESGHGIADARVFAPSQRTLAELTDRADWVAEDPDIHLGEAMRAAAAASGIQWVGATSGTDGVYRVELGVDPALSRRGVRAAVWRILGSVAESLSSVRELRKEGGAVFEVVTGMPDSAQFAGHGHTLLLDVRPNSPRTR